MEGWDDDLGQPSELRYVPSETVSFPTPIPDKGLVTENMFQDAMIAGDVGYCEGECNINLMSDALNAALASLIARELAKARLEEALWWEHLVGAVDPKHPDGKSETCMYCQRLVELTRLAKEQTT